MKEQLEKRIQKLKVELDDVQKLMDDLENGRAKSAAGPARRKRQAISMRVALCFIFLAAILLLDSNLQSQQQSDDALFIDSIGRVGIGTDQPETKLDIAQNQAIKIGQAYLSSGGNLANLATNEWFDGQKWQATAPGALIQIRGQDTVFFTHDGKGNHSSHMIVKAAGNVGIGTPDPKSKLEVAQNQAIKIGNAYLSSGGNFAHLATNEWFDGQKWQATAPGALIQIRGQDTVFYTHDEKGQHSSHMIVKAAGNVGIGTPDPKSKLEVEGDARISGDARIGGKVTHSGRLQVDDQAEITYQISPRYHLSLSGRIYGGKTKTIPHDTLKALCADPDGCQVRLAMTRWSVGTETGSASVFFSFYYSQTGDGHWRASATDAENAEGVDGDGEIVHVREIWETCYFTDGTYANNKTVGDKTQGMQLLVYNDGKYNYNNINRTCELTLID